MHLRGNCEGCADKYDALHPELAPRTPDRPELPTFRGPAWPQSAVRHLVGRRPWVWVVARIL